jgi:spore coat polysaccharide biosynthesis protein SpsF (cytidylyltransferase family)
MIVVIVQARMGSNRLPGKVMADLCGEPVIAHVIARARAIQGIDSVSCAVPQGADNDRLADTARAVGATVTRGPETDVLARYQLAAQACGATVVMRVTADCPVLSPTVSGQVLADFLAHRPDYASNGEPRSWPRGYDTEVFSRDALERAAREAVTPYQREHVTPWLLETAGIVRRNVALTSGDYSRWRWTLDYPEDLAFLRALLGRCRPLPHLPDFGELRALVQQDPALASINSHLP